MPFYLRLSAPLAAATLLLLVGCHTGSVHDDEYTMVAHALDYTHASISQQEEPAGPVAQELAGPHPVEEYLAYALANNPEIQAARRRVDAAAERIPQAESLDDPMLQTGFFPEPVQTAAGQQQFSLSASQRFPWPGKLRQRAAAAEAEVEIAQAHLDAVELDVTEQLRLAYYELYFLQRAVEITQTNREIVESYVPIAKEKSLEPDATQHDLLRAQLEVLNVDNELLQLKESLQTAQARLARVLAISPETDLRALAELQDQPIPQEIARLYEQAVEARPELRAQLAAVHRDRHHIELAELDYYPDVTTGLTWIDTADHGISPVANGRDSFLVGLGVNLPIYRRRLDSGLREAVAQTAADARQYDALRDRTREQVKDLFSRVEYDQELLMLFREEIVPTAEDTLNLSETAYTVGQVDIEQLINNWEQLLKFQLMQQRLEARLRQNLASLERVVGGSLQQPSELEDAAPEGPR